MDIIGYENYKIFEDGSCLSKSRIKHGINGKVISEEQFLKPRMTKNYASYMLYKDGVGKTFHIHRLVAMHYLPNPQNYKVVNHKDCDKLNNNKDNLEWCSSIYNSQSFNKTINVGTIIKNKNLKKVSYTGKIVIYGKVYYTKAVATREKAQELINDIVDKFKQENTII